MIAAGNLFTSCIQQLEPTGIQEMREAKAEYYEALAGLKNADAAYRQAQAKYEDARTKLKEAEVKAKELENAATELENAKLKATNEAEIAERKAQCEAALVAWQKTITDKQKELAQAEYELQDKLREIAALSMGLTETEKSVLNAAITGYEKAIEDYNEAVAALYRAQFDLYEAQYDKAAGIAKTDYDEEEITKYAESYEDSVAFYTLTKVVFEKKLAEYVLTDDPAVWEAELEEIQDSIATWEYNANIIDADMAKKFANEYYDGVKAWNEAYAAYVKANEPQKDPILLNVPERALFLDKEGKPAAYTKELPVHTVGTRTFVNYFNTYLREWTAGAEIVTPGGNIFSDRNDVFTVSGLTIDNYDRFLNGKPDNKDVIGLNGILETLERDLVLKGDPKAVAELKEKMEAAQKKFYSADSVVRAGLFAYKPFADTLALAKEAISGMNADAKALYEAQDALIKAMVDYAKGIGRQEGYSYGNPIASYADSVSLFTAFKNFAVARADYFGDGSILAGYWESAVTAQKAKDSVKYLNSLPYYTYDGAYTPKKGSVDLDKIEFSGFQQTAIRRQGVAAWIPEPVHIEKTVTGLTFSSLYGGEGLLKDIKTGNTVGPVWNTGYTVNTESITYDPTAESAKFWNKVYELGQQVPANLSDEDAFIKVVYRLVEASKVEEYDIDSDPVKFWDDVFDMFTDPEPEEAEIAAYLSRAIGAYGCYTVKDAPTAGGKYHVYYGVGDGKEEVTSQSVINLLYAVYRNLAKYCDIYNEYWGGDGSATGGDKEDLARENHTFVDKNGVKTKAKDYNDGGETKWERLVWALVDGTIVKVEDGYASTEHNYYNWSVKTFTEPYKIVYFYDCEEENPNAINFKELRIALQNLELLTPGGYNTDPTLETVIFNGPANATLLSKMFQAEQEYEMYANAKDAIEIVKQLKDVDADVKAAAAEVQKVLEAYNTALTGYGQDYVTFYKTLTGDVKGADEVVKDNTEDGVVNWDAVVEALHTTVHKVMKKENENYILNHIKDDQWTVKGEMKAMAEKYLPTYPADYHATKQLKGHSAEMIKLYTGLYNALDKTYLIAVQMKDPELIGKVVEITHNLGPWGSWTETVVVEPKTFQEAYENIIDNCSSAIEYCENKIAYFEKMIALVEAGFGPVDARISALEAQVEYYTQALVDAQVKLDVAKAKYDAAIAAYAE